jgi:hypothetical protein
LVSVGPVIQFTKRFALETQLVEAWSVRRLDVTNDESAEAPCRSDLAMRGGVQGRVTGEAEGCILRAFWGLNPLVAEPGGGGQRGQDS